MDHTPTPDERLETALAKVLEALPGAGPRERAFLLKRAGDVCVGLNEQRKALGWYGRAVDQFLELADPGEAEVLCRLIIFVQPDAVRARCTLTWIALGTGSQADALQELAAYVDAARKAGQLSLAAQQLAWMFAATSSPALRERIVLEMCELGETARAEGLAAQLGGEPPAPLPRDQLWARVLDATVGPAAITARTSA